jgi:purine-nucleoside phosphorylase
MDPFAAAREAADWLRQRTGRHRFDTGVVLGSGWGPLVDEWGEPLARFPIEEVPHFLEPVAEGHRGEVLAHDVGDHAVLVLSGRTHLFEGHGHRPVVHGVRTLAALGAGRLLLTNAGGSLRYDEWEIGQPVLLSGHLNLTATSPVEGARFVDLTDAWSAAWRQRARGLDPSLPEGVYAQLRGPHYNTFAEADWLRRVGADLVGMSTVPEAIAAREAGLEVLGLSVVSAIEGSHDRSVAGGGAIDPEAVVAAAEATARRLGPLVRQLV